MRLDRGWIESHIPHRARMCLLDEVVSWDAARISCRAVSHRDPDHPLRAHGRLGVACGVEYAAQAMAVHGALASSALAVHSGSHGGPPMTPTPAAGFLASCAACASSFCGSMMSPGI